MPHRSTAVTTYQNWSKSLLHVRRKHPLKKSGFDHFDDHRTMTVSHVVSSENHEKNGTLVAAGSSSCGVQPLPGRPKAPKRLIRMPFRQISVVRGPSQRRI
jgi:hypothetical protein